GKSNILTTGLFLTIDMLTTLLIFWPLAATLLVMIFRGDAAKRLALAGALVELVISLVAAIQFERNAEAQFLVNVPWVESLGISYHVGMDGISLMLVLLTTVLTPLIILSSFRN